MTSKLCILIFVGLSFINSAFADDICVTNGKDLALLKNSFPKFLQSQTELHFASSESPVAYISVTITPTQIKGDAKYKIPIFGVITKNGYATNFCYNKEDRELKITLNNGKDFTFKVINDNPPDATVTVKGYTLTRRPSEYNAAMAILNGTSTAPASGPAHAIESGGAN